MTRAAYKKNISSINNTLKLQETYLEPASAADLKPLAEVLPGFSQHSSVPAIFSQSHPKGENW